MVRIFDGQPGDGREPSRVCHLAHAANVLVPKGYKKVIFRAIWDNLSKSDIVFSMDATVQIDPSD